MFQPQMFAAPRLVSSARAFMGDGVTFGLVADGGSGFLTGRRHSVLPGGLVVAQGEQHGLDGPDEDRRQATVEDDVKQQDFDCEGKETKKQSKCGC